MRNSVVNYCRCGTHAFNGVCSSNTIMYTEDGCGMSEREKKKVEKFNEEWPKV